MGPVCRAGLSCRSVSCRLVSCQSFSCQSVSCQSFVAVCCAGRLCQPVEERRSCQSVGPLFRACVHARRSCESVVRAGRAGLSCQPVQISLPCLLYRARLASSQACFASTLHFLSDTYRLNTKRSDVSAVRLAKASAVTATVRAVWGWSRFCITTFVLFEVCRCCNVR